MKLKSNLCLVSLCSAFALVLVPNTRGAVSDPVLMPPAKDYAREQEPSSTSPVAPALTREEALKLITAARKYVAHPQKEPNQVIAEPKVTTPDFNIAEPPPAPRAEPKPEAPGSGLVWVEGHYMPVKGEWRWVRGEWAMPALPISVWIPARYDTKEKKWAPGYWQPDVASTTAPDPAAKDGKSAAPSQGY
jgi:hypothetical protein